MTQKSTSLNGFLWVTLVLVWSTSYAVIKLGVATIDPMVLVAGRMIIGAVVMYCVMRVMGQSLSKDIKIWGSYAATGLLGSTIPFLFISYGEQSVDSALAAILMGIAPVATVAFAAFVIPDEPLTKRVLFGVSCALVGVVLLVGPGALAGLGQNLPGQLAVVAATLCYACSTIYTKLYVRRPAFEMAAGSMLVGALFIGAVTLLTGRNLHVEMSITSLGAVVYLGLFSTACANLIYFHLVPRLGATRMSQVNFAVPVVGSLIGVVALGEQMTPNRLVALVIIAYAIYLVLTVRKNSGLPLRVKAE